MRIQFSGWLLHQICTSKCYMQSRQGMSTKRQQLILASCCASSTLMPHMSLGKSVHHAAVLLAAAIAVAGSIQQDDLADAIYGDGVSTGMPLGYLLLGLGNLSVRCIAYISMHLSY